MEDAAIVALYWQRDPQAITETDGKYGPFCRRVAQNILTLPEDVEECVNDVWHRAWNTMPPQRPDSLRAYLGRIVRNLSLDRWRREHTQKRGNGMELLLSELEECVPTAQSTEEIVEAAELSRSIPLCSAETERICAFHSYSFAHLMSRKSISSIWKFLRVYHGTKTSP